MNTLMLVAVVATMKISFGFLDYIDMTYLYPAISRSCSVLTVSYIEDTFLPEL